MNIIKDIIKHRKESQRIDNGTKVRHDFIDLLLEVQQEDKDFCLSHEQLATCAFVFFVAGAETSSNTISFALYELARVPQIQEKLRNEIMNHIKKCEDHLTYDSLMDMKYLNMVIQEVLRKYPALPEITRKTTKPCMLGDTDIHLPINLKIVVPVSAIHYDPKYYPNPNVFDPERFSDEIKQTRPNTTYLPFGKGSRNCIGKWFGQIQSKLCLIMILKNYRISVCDKMDIPYKSTKMSLTSSSHTGIYLKFEKVEC